MKITAQEIRSIQRKKKEDNFEKYLMQIHAKASSEPDLNSVVFCERDSENLQNLGKYLKELGFDCEFNPSDGDFSANLVVYW